ncbi:MAG: L,D-transpeptidase [Verrucomicrobiales bacterium]
MLKTGLFLGMAALLSILCNCSSTGLLGNRVVVSVDDQRLVLINNGAAVKSYPVSTSKFGLGSASRSYKTPLGEMYVYQKIGGGMRGGTVFKNRRPTGEVVGPNAPGRDPIVSRILWLEGLERANSNTKERLIYIHGTPEERTIGWPTSYGCIRMKSRDVIDFYARVNRGTGVYVKKAHLTPEEIPKSERVLLAAARTRSLLTIPRRGEARSSNVLYAAAEPLAAPFSGRLTAPAIPAVGDTAVQSPRHESVLGRLFGLRRISGRAFTSGVARQ